MKEWIAGVLFLLFMGWATGIINIVDANAKDGRSTYMAAKCLNFIDNMYFNKQLKTHYRYSYLPTQSNYYIRDESVWISLTAFLASPWNSSNEISYKLSCKVDTATFEIVDHNAPELYRLKDVE